MDTLYMAGLGLSRRGRSPSQFVSFLQREKLYNVIMWEKARDELFQLSQDVVRAHNIYDHGKEVSTWFVNELWVKQYQE